MSLLSPHTGQTHVSGKSLNSVPAFIPAFSFPTFGLYIYLHTPHSYFSPFSLFSVIKFLYPKNSAAITISKNDKAFQIPLSNNIIAKRNGKYGIISFKDGNVIEKFICGEEDIAKLKEIINKG
mgnify:CR=1 FL=1